MKTKINAIPNSNICCNTKAHRILFAFTLLIMLFIIGCSQDKTPCNKHTQHTSLSDDDKNKIPYTGTDTLVFISNTNDTVKCIGTGKITSQDCVDNGGSPDCPIFTSTMCYDNLSWNYADTSNKLKISLQLTQSKDFNYRLYDYLLDINSSTKFYAFASRISLVGSTEYIPSLIVNGKNYFDVTYINRNFNDTTSRIYCNKTYGIIKIELNNQLQIWNLK